MLIVDAHLDLAWNALQWGRDLSRPAHSIRTMEGGTPGKGRALGTVALPDLRRGRVALCFATVLARSTGAHVPHLDFPSPAQSNAVARGQLAYYRALERLGQARVVAGRADLDAHMSAWERWEDDPTGEPPPVGLVISMEGADPILDPGELAEWRALGLRVVGPAHYGPGRYAGGTGSEGPLTPLGRELLAEMGRQGSLLDVTHLADPAFWEALELFDGPVLASHNNCRALVPHQRQFSDEQLRAVIARDGVVGAALDTWMLHPGWIVGAPDNPPVPLERVVDHIDHVCQLAGSSRHAAIGSDLDGGFGREQTPHDLDTVADLQRLPELLARRGYAETDIAAIAHGNWLRLLRRAWG
ncbi:MAG TPA: membrane dipeptidase [Chloroflexaceae bacterium]|nr:membrane dipeptidase [Chloroflexaceae bacterium]